MLQLGEQWSSSTLTGFTNDLSANTTNANAGKLVGNRMFYANDYMVHPFPQLFSRKLSFWLPDKSWRELCDNGQDVFIEDTKH